MVNLQIVIVILIILVLFYIVFNYGFKSGEGLTNRPQGYNFDMTDPEQIVSMEYQPKSDDWRMSDADILKSNGDTNYYGGENYHKCGEGVEYNKYKTREEIAYCGSPVPNRFNVKEGLGFDYATYQPGKVRRNWNYSPGEQSVLNLYKTRNNYINMNPEEYKTPCSPVNEKYLEDVAQQSMALQQQYGQMIKPPIKPFTSNPSIGSPTDRGDSYDRLNDLHIGGNKAENFSMNPSGDRLRPRALPMNGRDITSPNDRIGMNPGLKGYSYLNERYGYNPNNFDSINTANAKGQRLERMEDGLELKSAKPSKGSAARLSRHTQKGEEELFDNQDVINNMWTFDVSQQYDIPDVDINAKHNIGLDSEKFDANTGLAMRARVNADRARRSKAGTVRHTRNYYETFLSDELRENENRAWWGIDPVESTTNAF